MKELYFVVLYEQYDGVPVILTRSISKIDQRIWGVSLPTTMTFKDNPQFLFTKEEIEDLKEDPKLYTINFDEAAHPTTDLMDVINGHYAENCLNQTSLLRLAEKWQEKANEWQQLLS